MIVGNLLIKNNYVINVFFVCNNWIENILEVFKRLFKIKVIFFFI